MGKSNMIKRADGSYSQRGLWDNIRANKGSGKKPTKQMLEQERKIKSKMEMGGYISEYQTGGTTPKPKPKPKPKPPQTNYGFEKYYNRPDLFEKDSIDYTNLDDFKQYLLMKTGTPKLPEAKIYSDSSDWYNDEINKILKNNPDGFKDPILAPTLRNYDQRSYQNTMKHNLLQEPYSEAFNKLPLGAKYRMILKKPMPEIQEYKYGGTNNPGFNALPEEVQENILAHMSMGGRLMDDHMYAEGGKLPDSILKSRLKSHMSPEEANEYMANYGGGGYVVKRSSERKGKTHVVIGPDGTKKYFGDSKLGQHPNDPERKKAFYARHKKNLANNPYFRAFARKTWAEGGTIGEEELDQYADGGKTGMMKARMALDAEFGNPAAKRMVSANPKTGMTPEGIGTHYMTSMGNYAVPLLQDFGGANLRLVDGMTPSKEDMRFESPEDAEYFAQHYKEIAPMMRNFKEYKYGGIHIKPENKGKFTAWAKSHGMGVQEAASHVMANKDKYSSTIVKRANFAKNAAKFKHADGGLVKYPGGGETELNPPNIGNFTNIPVTNKFYNQPLADQTSQIANYAASNPNVKAGTFSIPGNNMTPKSNTPTIPLGYTDNVGYTPSVDTNTLPSAYNKKDWSQQYVPQTKSAYYTYNPTGQRYTTDQYNTYKSGAQPMIAGLPTQAMGGQLTKYRYVNGKFIPMHGFGDTTVGAAVKDGQAIAPTLSVAQSFVGDNNTPLSEALNYGAQGASAGAMFGPWGAAIGGGIGLVGGAVKGYFDQEEQIKKQRELDQQKKNISTYNQLMGRAPQSNLAIKTNTQAMYAEGGMKVISRNHPNPQEEVEGGETAITPSGRNIQFKGPKHNNGGIKTNLPSGTRIFSDRIIYPG